MIPHNIPEAMFAHRDLARAIYRRRHLINIMAFLLLVGAPLALLCGVAWLIYRMIF